MSSDQPSRQKTLLPLVRQAHYDTTSRAAKQKWPRLWNDACFLFVAPTILRFLDEKKQPGSFER